MPTKKKRAFTKNNSVKFLLLHGNEKAVNADGKTLENVLVPISSNYKPGSSLLVNRITELVNESNPPAPTCNEPNLQKLLDQFDDASDSEAEEDFNAMQKKLKKLQFEDDIERLNRDDLIVEEEYEDDGEEEDLSDFSDDNSDYSATSNSDKYSSFKRDCPENLKILEEQIEKKLEEYDDDQLGALDDEDICGYLTGENERVNYFIGTSKKHREENFEIGNYDQLFKEKILKYSEEDHVEKIVEIVTEKAPEWDCESIISTYSNKYNHPSIIREEGKIRKIKIPNNPLQKQLTKSKLKQLESDSESEEYSDDDNISVASTINIRPKGETPEQKQERKKLFKQLKSENRKLKKENKIAFKNEKKFQIAQALNVQKNRGKRLL